MPNNVERLSALPGVMPDDASELFRLPGNRPDNVDLARRVTAVSLGNANSEVDHSSCPKLASNCLGIGFPGFTLL